MVSCLAALLFRLLMPNISTIIHSVTAVFAGLSSHEREGCAAVSVNIRTISDISLHFLIHNFLWFNISLSSFPEAFYDRFFIAYQTATTSGVDGISQSSLVFQVAIKLHRFFLPLFSHSIRFSLVFFLGFLWMRFAINNVIKASQPKEDSQWNYWNLIAFDIVECTCWCSVFFHRNCCCRVAASCTRDENLRFRSQELLMALDIWS